MASCYFVIKAFWIGSKCYFPSRLLTAFSPGVFPKGIGKRFRSSSAGESFNGTAGAEKRKGKCIDIFLKVVMFAKKYRVHISWFFLLSVLSVQRGDLPQRALHLHPGRVSLPRQISFFPNILRLRTMFQGEQQPQWHLPHLHRMHWQIRHHCRELRCRVEPISWRTAVDRPIWLCSFLKGLESAAFSSFRQAPPPWHRTAPTSRTPASPLL